MTMSPSLLYAALERLERCWEKDSVISDQSLFFCWETHKKLAKHFLNALIDDGNYLLNDDTIMPIAVEEIKQDNNNKIWKCKI